MMRTPRSTGAILAPVEAGVSIAALLFAGASFVFARGARLGAIAGIIALLLGALIHWQWSSMLGGRMDLLPATLAGDDRAMVEESIQFAANAQVPHILKNRVLAGVCVVVFVFAPYHAVLCDAQMKENEHDACPFRADRVPHLCVAARRLCDALDARHGRAASRNRACS